MKKKQRIDYVKFEHPRQHPQFVTLLSGVDPVEVINKLMNAPPGPEDYDSIFNQLLVYEGLYYATAVPGKVDGDELTRYRIGLSQMAGPGSKIYGEMGQDARLESLIKKRAEVFQLYGLNPDDQSIPGFALCARCALHMTAQCNAALVADTGEDPSVWLLADGREHASIERQTEVVLEQMKLCLDTAGSSLEHVLKCNVYCTSVEKFAAVNAVYTRYFPGVPPARIFICVVAWAGLFDIEIDCVATVKE